MRFRLVVASAVLILAADGASAAGCRRPNGVGSTRYSTGINSDQPGRAIFNPCSSDYHFGANLRRREKREYPGAVIQH